MNNVIKNILNRRSCRSYNKKRVNEEKLDQILQCGIYAPSGRNLQTPRLIAINNASYANKLRNACLKEFNRDCFYSAKTMILVVVHKEDKLGIQDASCALENMMLAAASLKVGSCWINQVNDLLNTASGSELRKLFNISEDEIVVGSLSLGYPSKENKTKDLPRKENRIVKF